jgi:hypothetical protein
VNQSPRPDIKTSVRRQERSVLCQTIKRRSRIAREYFMRADQGRPDILELFQEEAEVYFPKFGFARSSFSSFLEMVKGFEGALEYIQHDYMFDFNVIPGKDRLRARRSSRSPRGRFGTRSVEAREEVTGESRSGRHAKPSAAERGRLRTSRTTLNHKQKEIESWSAS